MRQPKPCRLTVVVGLIAGLTVLSTAFASLSRSDPPYSTADQRDGAASDSGVLAETLRAAWPASGESETRVGTVAQAFVIETQDFEGATFPPPGWLVLDKEAERNGQPAAYTFGREECDVSNVGGGQAAAWALGGGTLGDDLPCGGLYPPGANVDSWLVYTLDATGLTAVRVNLLCKVDQPTTENFRVCASTGVPDEYACQSPPVEWHGWQELLEPLEFPEVTGQSEAQIAIVYEDMPASGLHKGLFVDQITIEGVPLSVTPTQPPVTASPTRTATRAPTVTPSATTTPVPPLHVPVAYRSHR